MSTTIALVAEPFVPSPPEPPVLRRFASYQLLAGLEFTGAIWILYLLDQGYSLTEIGIAEAAFHLAPVTLEIPSGVLADVLKRKWSLVLGSILAALSAALLIVAGGEKLWLVMIAMYIGGASYAFRSGAQQALLYDTLKERGQTATFTGILGRLISLSYVLIGLATWIGATLAGVSYVWPFGLTIGFALITAILAGSLHEPARDRDNRRSAGGTLRDAAAIIRSKPDLGALIVLSSLYWTMITLIGLYAQAVLADQGLPTTLIGLLVGGSLGVTALGSWFAARLTKRGRFAVWVVVVGIAGMVSALGLGAGFLALTVVTYLIGEFTAGIYEPVVASRYNDAISSGQRATILSTEGFLFSLTMIWAFPLAGWVAERAGWFTMYAVIAGLFGVALTIWYLAFGRQDVVTDAVEANTI